MRTRTKQFLYFPIALCLFAFIGTSNPNKYKCLIQMQNYTGEGAYVIVSLINKQGDYEKTLYVNGADDEWYFDISEWWNFYGKRRTSLDAITGATLSSGKRGMSMLEIEPNKINKGYKIRFETAVEDQEYYKKDVEIVLTDSIFNQKINGQGFIKYIRLIAQ
ncbi:DUF2271 domain-containing protein [Wenyingzhuangia aestuarii]|uniref:DUF2271 domain-containing protein n=1 Tax=Wenyingzhuangia aestuarii TaxID=1647582 RepID=UPI0014391F36|nr:DUF2271 domain-containing protein [Wenyingzhuangia aestuarii]NJB83698.1 hypothetical protein [Wenyingzhuangia aestuarii]